MNTGSGVDLIPATVRLVAAADKLDRGYYKQEHLIQELRGCDGYDLILVDCPPTLGVLTANAVFASNLLLVPFPLDTFAYSGLEDLIALTGSVRRDPVAMSLLVSQFDARTKRLNAAILDQLGDQRQMLLETRVPRCEAVRQAQGAQMPVLQYDTKATASEAFRSLATEILSREVDHHVAA